MAKEITCPLFKATGKKATKTECASCPLSECPEDIFNDAIVKVMQIIGDYLHGELKEERWK